MTGGNLLPKIDGIDKEILRFLMEDARKPILEIARKMASLAQPSTKDSEN
jgi:Lrp/AsnC family transcriptional regulator for asnA, asnC and gidA